MNATPPGRALIPMQLVAPGRRLSAFLFSLASSRVAFAQASRADPVLVVTVSASALELDSGPLRAAIGRELQLEGVAPDDDRASRARGHLDIALDGPAHQLVVTYSGGAGPLVRHVDLPPDRDATTRVVVMLAGNLGRDEAGELTESLRILAAAATPDRPAPERDDKEPPVLALNRLELRPLGGWSIAPNSVTRGFMGADVAYRMSRFFALGADASWYGPFNGSAGAQPSYPLTQSDWSAELDAYVVPWPAREGTSAVMGAFEPYVLGGIGLLASRPIAVLDPAHRHFDFNSYYVDLAFGVGVRAFLAQRLALTLEVRDLMTAETVENNVVARGSTNLSQSDPNNPDNPATWYSRNARFTNSVQVRLGADFFVF